MEHTTEKGSKERIRWKSRGNWPFNHNKERIKVTVSSSLSCSSILRLIIDLFHIMKSGSSHSQFNNISTTSSPRRTHWSICKYIVVFRTGDTVGTWVSNWVGDRLGIWEGLIDGGEQGLSDASLGSSDGWKEPRTPQHVTGKFSAAPSKSHLKSFVPTQAQLLSMITVPSGFVTSKVSVIGCVFALGW